MEKQQIWLTYDFAFGGDFEALFAFLDRHGAKECGGNLAYFSYNYPNDLIEDLQNDIKKHVTIKAQDRIYIIFKIDGKFKGRWLFGGRKKAPWSGYAFEASDAADDEA